MTTLVLWDVDGTLVRTGPVSHTAYASAVEAVLGRHPGDHDVRMSGKTDPQITAEILALMAVEDAQTHVPAVIAALERELAGASENLVGQGRVLPGAREVLSRLAADDSVVQAPLTGNTRTNARLKLSLFGLDHLLDMEVGAYGSDHHDRCRLVPVAVARLERLRGTRVEPDDVWVVGDTPNDLACARAAGARCLLVASGRFSHDELSGLGADSLLADMSDVGGAVAILTGEAR